MVLYYRFVCLPFSLRSYGNSVYGYQYILFYFYPFFMFQILKDKHFYGLERDWLQCTSQPINLSLGKARVAQEVFGQFAFFPFSFLYSFAAAWYIHTCQFQNIQIVNPVIFQSPRMVFISP
eukprot:TRINITY_DN2363_c1_g1_i2.p6 TRINITY_DN2363_c1_g1~~TRINITY_DN2363_c1_g1_i2.p6  ORF type:complete len:121 (+),score=2.29 TRINITY_DN2363_c1_g1_i2:523-885(+)